MSELKATIRALEKKLGEGCIVSADKARDVLTVIKRPTGVLALDIVLEGGLPCGKIIEFWGEPSSMKSTLTMLAGAAVTKAGGKIAIVDIEGSFTAEYAERLGQKLENVFVARPKNLEAAIDITEALIVSKEFDIVVFDSIGAAITLEELDKGADEHTMCSAAKRLTPAMGKFISALQPDNLSSVEARNDTTLIIINQMREKVGVMYGNPQTSKGGHAVKHACDVRLLTKCTGKIVDKSKEVIGGTFRITVIKSKVSVPKKQIEYSFYFDEGKVDNSETLILQGVATKVVKQKGAFYSYKEIENAKGKEAFILEVKKRPELLAQLKDDIVKNTKQVEDLDAVEEPVAE